jgi:hypothetical protein
MQTTPRYAGIVRQNFLFFQALIAGKSKEVVRLGRVLACSIAGAVKVSAALQLCCTL